MEIYSEDRELLRDLFKSSEGLDIYFFHEKYQLSPGQLHRSFQKFFEEGIVERMGDKLILNERGKLWVFFKRKEIFCSVENFFWRKSVSESARDYYRKLGYSEELIWGDYHPKVGKVRLPNRIG